MYPFPYLDILKKAFELARKEVWLWGFGLFIGASLAGNIVGLNYFFSHSARDYPRYLEEKWQFVLRFMSEDPAKFYVWAALVSFGIIIFVVLSGYAKGVVIWSAGKLAASPTLGKRLPRGNSEDVNFQTSLHAAKKYALRIIGLQIFVFLWFFLLLLLFALPVFYLFSAGVYSRAIILGLLGLVILIPTGVVAGFFHLYGPIFITLYGVTAEQALGLSFNLLKNKLVESIILASFLIGLSVVFILIVTFSIILLALPLVLFFLLMNYWGYPEPAILLKSGAIIIGSVYITVFWAGFSIFRHIAWVIAVTEMVKARKMGELEEKALAAEAAV